MKYSEIESQLLELNNKQLPEKEREFLFNQVEQIGKELKEAEEKIPKNFVQIILYTFIFLVVSNSSIEKISIGFISLEEISLIEIFLPALISFHIFRLWMNTFYRNSTSKTYESLYRIMMPNLYENKTHELFYPFSIREILSKLLDDKTGFWIRKTSLLSVLIMIYFTIFLSFILLVYAYGTLFEKYHLEFPINKNSINFIYVICSLMLSSSFILLSGCSMAYHSYLNRKEPEIEKEKQEPNKVQNGK